MIETRIIQPNLFEEQAGSLAVALHFLRQHGPGPRHWIGLPCWVRMINVWLPARFDRLYDTESAVIVLIDTAGCMLQRFDCPLERIRFTKPEPHLIEETPHRDYGPMVGLEVRNA